MTTLSREPIHVELGGRPRKIAFDLNTAILIRDAGFENKPLTSKIGEDEHGTKYQANLDAVRAYLRAALQDDAEANGEPLDIKATGRLVQDEDIWPVIAKINRALLRFYGQEPKQPGEVKAAAVASGSKSRGRSKRGSASSVGS